MGRRRFRISVQRPLSTRVDAARLSVRQIHCGSTRGGSSMEGPHMSTTDFSRLEAIFNNALAIEALDQRAAFLDKECGDDTDLRQRVDALLASHTAVADDFLPPPTLTTSTKPGETSPGFAEGIGPHIGRYKLLDQIGEGGFGAVFLAEQEYPV